MRWMAASLACAGALLAGELKVENLRMVVSEFGPRKADARVVPGEKLVVLLDVTGMTEKEGRLRFVLGFTVVDAKGEKVADYAGQEQNAADAFHRGPLACTVTVNFPAETPPGKYTLTVRLEDKCAGQTVETTQEFEVVPQDFRVINARLALDDDGKQAHGPFVTDGEDLFLVFSIVGLTEQKKKAHVQVDLSVLDASGKEIHKLENLVNAQAKPKDGLLSANIGVHFTGDGVFTLRATVRDVLAEKDTTFDFPVRIGSLSR